MISYLQWKLMTFYLVESFNENHSNELAGIAEYAVEIANLEQAVSNILVAEGIQGTNTKGLRQNAVAAKRIMAATVVQYAHKGLPFARKAKNNDLITNLNKSKSYIFRPHKSDAISRAKVIRDTLSGNTGILTNIKPADLSAIDASIVAFEEAHMKPKMARSHKKIYGTEAYKKEFEDARLAVQNMYDYLIGYFAITNHALVEEFEDFMAIEKEGVRHTGLMAYCKDAKPPVDAITDALQHVNLKIVELNLVAKTNIRGIGAIAKFKQGTYHVEFWKDGFEKVEKIIHFKQGKTVKVELQMVRV